MIDNTKFIQGQKYLFALNEFDDSAIYKIASDHGLSFALAKVLYSRNFRDADQINSYLFTTDELIPHPKLLLGCEVAAQRIIQAIEKGEKILIAGDYDVDGITSSALMLIALLPLNASINYFLPNREVDGYGLSRKTVLKAAKSGYKLIVTVDNGITAIDAANAAAEVGVDLIITDHHRPHGEVPKALSIVNPNQDGCTYPFKGLTGVGVIFKLLSLIYEQKGLSMPQKAYELLMLGTIADVAPLVDENRFWVRSGLSKINKGKSYAIKVLMQNGNLTKDKLNSLDIGFMIAPQINALGRLSDSRDAVKFLISSSKEDVESIGKILLEMNEARKKIERSIYSDIVRKIEKGIIDLTKNNVIVATGSDWPAGVVGLVAGKLMHAYGKPTLILHELDNGILKGSCRSIKAFNIFDALNSSKDLLISFGGHSFAAGLAIKKDNIEELKSRIEEKIAKELTPFDLVQKLGIDADIGLEEINNKLISDLEKLSPFGNQNEQPIFLAKNVHLLNKPQLLKEQHVKCYLFSNGVIKPTIFFNRPDLYEVLNELNDKTFSVAGHISTNEWEGKSSIQIQGLDIALD